MRRKFTLILLALFVLTLAVTPASAKFSYNVDVYVNGEYVYFPDQKPFVDTKTNRTYVPIRFVAEELGAKVDWDAQKMTAVIGRDGKTVTVTVGTNIAYVDNKLVTLDAVAMLVNQRTVVPLRFVSEALGEKVKWEPGLRGKVLIGEGALSGKPVDVAKLEKIHGVAMTQTSESWWEYIPPWEEVLANKDRSHYELQWSEGGSVWVGIAWARILPDIREVKVDLTPIRKTLDGFFPGHPKIPEIMAKAREMADIARASGGSEQPGPVSYHLNGQRVMLQSGGGNFVSLYVVYPESDKEYIEMVGYEAFRRQVGLVE